VENAESKMNWYKTAKLADLAYHSGSGDNMPLQCAYCGRWATNPISAGADRSDYVWKSDQEADPEEKMDMQKATANEKASHGICPKCFQIGQETDFSDPAKIKELSFQQL